MKCSKRIFFTAGALVVLVATVYGSVVTHEFINYDVKEYVYGNQHVTSGLTGESIRWAFRTDHVGYFPLTYISHMIDCSLYGLEPGGHHLTSLLFHAINTVLVFVLLWRVTGAHWRSAIVAGLFAVHPTNVEAVAWIAARKDMVSTLFVLLALIAYCHYASRPSVRRYVLAPSWAPAVPRRRRARLAGASGWGSR